MEITTTTTITLKDAELARKAEDALAEFILNTSLSDASYTSLKAVQDNLKNFADELLGAQQGLSEPEKAYLADLPF